MFQERMKDMITKSSHENTRIWEVCIFPTSNKLNFKAKLGFIMWNICQFLLYMDMSTMNIRLLLQWLHFYENSLLFVVVIFMKVKPRITRRACNNKNNNHTFHNNERTMGQALSYNKIFSNISMWERTPVELIKYLWI